MILQLLIQVISGMTVGFGTTNKLGKEMEQQHTHKQIKKKQSEETEMISVKCSKCGHALTGIRCSNCGERADSAIHEMTAAIEKNVKQLKLIRKKLKVWMKDEPKKRYTFIMLESVGAHLYAEKKLRIAENNPRNDLGEILEDMIMCYLSKREGNMN